MKEGASSQSLKRFLANYPLTFYFGLVLIGLAILLVVLRFQYDWQMNLHDFSVWISRYTTEVTAAAVFLLGIVMIGSAIAYRQTCQMNKDEYYLWLVQRSTRTLFPFFTPVHDWLRLRIRIYRWWHTVPFASSVHILGLIVVVLLATSSVRSVMATASPTPVPSSTSPTGVQPAQPSGVVAQPITQTPVLDSPVTATPVSATQLSVQIATSNLTVGHATNITVTAKDINSNVVTGYAGTVSFSSTDPAANLPSSYTFTSADSGVRVWSSSVVLHQLGSQKITVMDGSGLSGSTNVSVSPGPLAEYSISTSSSSRAVNVGWQETVTAKDAYGNTLNDVSTTITPSSTGHAVFYADNTDQTIAQSYSLTSGVVTIYIKDTVSEALILSVGDSQNVTGRGRSITIAAQPGGAPSAGTSSDQPPSSQNTVNPPTNIVGQTAAAVQTFFKSQPNTLAGVTIVSAVAPAAVLFASAPVGVVLTTTATTAAAQGAPVFYMLFAGLLPFHTRRRQTWGTVRHVLSGLPIAGVFVELLDEKGSRLNRTLTDQTGHYGFLPAQPGSYQIRILNPLYGTYLSPIITVTDPSKQIITDDIALLPVSSRLSSRLVQGFNWVKLMRIFSWLYWPLLIIGSLLTIALLFQAVTIGRLLISALYLVFWIAKLAQLGYDRPYGVVVDASTGQPVALAVVQLTAVKNEGRIVVHSTITDNRGRFLFTVRPDKYELIVIKEGYQPNETKLSGDKVNLKVSLSARPAAVESGFAQGFQPTNS